MAENIMLTPGPTQVPEAARLAMARTLIHHRTPEFVEILGEVRRELQWVYQTSEEVLVLTCSGTGAFEAAIINFTRRQDKLLAVGGGKFGERWAEIGRAYGMQVIDYEVPWGQVADPEVLAKLLAEHPDCAMVTISASETSTGVYHPMEEVSRVVRAHGALLAVDAITALGVHPLRMDAMGIDVLVSGAQKAFSIPPGLAFVAASERAWARYKTSDHPKYYFDLGRERKQQMKGDTAFTPAISLVLALREVLKMMRAEGLESIWARHERYSRAARMGAQAMGLRLYTESPSHAVTAVLVPPGISAPAVVERCRDVHGVTLAGGQDRLKGDMIRIGHLGYIGERDIVAGLSALEQSLREEGMSVVGVGEGVRAAQAVLLGL